MGPFIAMLVAASFGGFVLYGVIWFVTRLPGGRLRTKFIRMGTLVGKSRAEIESVVGPPHSVSAVNDDLLLQWMRPGYHIVLIFRDDVCQGVSHEAAV